MITQRSYHSSDPLEDRDSFRVPVKWRRSTCSARAPARRSQSPLTARVPMGQQSMWLCHVLPGSFRRGPRRGQQYRLCLRPVVPNSVAPCSSAQAPPHGLQSLIGACGAGDAEQSVPLETEHA
jgi:hypothetical protein